MIQKSFNYCQGVNVQLDATDAIDFDMPFHLNFMRKQAEIMSEINLLPYCQAFNER